MTSCTSQQSTANCFIDLATFSEAEGYYYGGPHAITWFVRGVQKANWFSFIPISLRSQGTHDFGHKMSSSAVNRSGDYVLNIWFRAQIPQIQLSGTADIFADSKVRWTRNLMHNLFSKVSMTFNELTVAEMDNYFLDVHYQFNLVGAKRIGYRNMIGDIATMTANVGPGDVLGTGGFFEVPFPFWFAQDSGVALPIAALPFNDVKINYDFRRWQDLIVVHPGTAGGARAAVAADVHIFGQPTNEPALANQATWCHYAVLHNDERVKMGDAPRDMLIKQIQSPQASPINDLTVQSTIDLRLSHAIIVFYFMAQNISHLKRGDGGGEWSNYTTEPGYSGGDPVSDACLTYESTTRVRMGADYYSLMAPYFWSDAIPDWSGYHEYSYSLHPGGYNPAGSTNYSKLANVSLSCEFSTAAQNAGAAAPVDSNGADIQLPNSAGDLVAFPQIFQKVFIAENWNVGRIANGSFGHPTL
uniref:Major capsid protein n=1 Tax=Marseillevirus LCMAC103 TaxID=2506604 RepID=A0A481YV95_9VIRU|nr:MAG: major capsid protein [Marseillevirus LCMAC103]